MLQLVQKLVSTMRNRPVEMLSRVMIALFLLVSVGLVSGVELFKAESDPLPSRTSFNTNELVAVAPPPFSEGVFPCSDCHDPSDEVDTTPRHVEDHEDIVFEHDAENRWCLDCHDQENRDKLRLASGALIDFSESHRLCGQCHGPKYRDWKAGDHGKRTGYWNGRKEYLLCVHCHDPHSPGIKSLTPEPPPIKPEELR